MGSGFSLGKVKEVFDANKSAEEAVAETVRVAVEVCPGAPRALAEALKRAFFPVTATGLVHVAAAAPGAAVAVNPETDLCVVLCGTATDVADSVGRAWLATGVRTVLVAESAVEMPPYPLDVTVPWGTVTAQDPDRMLGALADWCVGATDKAMALAASFPFCRAALAKSETLACALANAGVGAIDLVKGADFPVMFATEAGLVARIASVYGYGAGRPDVPALVGVAAMGIVTREAARRLCAWAPGVAWLVRGALGWAGTVAVGALATARFEAGDQFDEQVERLREQLTDAVDELRHRASLAAGHVVEVGGATYSEPERRGDEPEAEDVPAAGIPVRWFAVGDGRAMEA